MNDSERNCGNCINTTEVIADPSMVYCHKKKLSVWKLSVPCSEHTSIDDIF